MKKVASLLILAVIVIVSLIALNRDTPSNNALNQISTTDTLHDFKNKELNIAVFQGGYGPEYWNEIVSEFESAYPGVKINMTNSPRIGDVVRPQIVAGNPPDVLVVTDTEQSGLITSLVKEKALLDISDVFESKALDNDQLLKDRILPGMLESTRFSPYQDGKVYLAPLNTGPMGLIYNKKLFRDKGWKLPETWDDFFALGEELKKEENYLVDSNGNKTQRALFTYQGIYPDYLEEIMYPSLANAAGIDNLKRIFAYEPGSFSTDMVKKVLDTFARIGTEGYLMNGTVALNHTQSQTDMMLGKAIFIVNGTWMENEMKNAPREENFEFGMIPVPVFNKGDQRFILMSYEQFSIPVRASNPELAKEFLKFLYTDQSVKLFAEKSNGIFALKGASELSKPYLTKGVYEMFSAYDGATTILQEWKALSKGSRIDIKTELFRNTMTPIMTGKMTTDQWMDKVEQSFAQIQSEQVAN
ncbi:carbohydrate ABC transporter substrate-binding protein [Paenibacillus endoradicis]|uniref:carbohydrate ABC transporter substrate-binding protein n=1 Tax=Paenibacillus endoradicis TaxID=2972487 RepID=UPI002158B93A|nr:carbohydrate ABC transporter substrate-binding protein [Paenibacillus endoradicis]MCR8660561.1 carbohydrate ABC transporter substrate-binding protein [Paenibacillus endoradicis]